tara:strand:+ start:153 stop:416 length:264 start_codon:yes stop_codon:yes gene_type:complete
MSAKKAVNMIKMNILVILLLFGSSEYLAQGVRLDSMGSHNLNLKSPMSLAQVSTTNYEDNKKKNLAAAMALVDKKSMKNVGEETMMA